jgi:hypothetical protein
MKSSTDAATSGLSGSLMVTTECPFGFIETVATCLESNTTAQSVGPMGEKRTYTMVPSFLDLLLSDTLMAGTAGDGGGVHHPAVR